MGIDVNTVSVIDTLVSLLLGWFAKVVHGWISKK
jgi:hypothetical protein